MTRQLLAIVAAIALIACTEASNVGPTDAPLFNEVSVETMLGALGEGEAHSASVAKGFGCVVGVAGGFPGVFTTESHAVMSNSGKVTMLCHGQLPAGTEPAKAQVQRSTDFPISCGAYFATATRWQQEITPSGEINLRCQKL